MHGQPTASFARPYHCRMLWQNAIEPAIKGASVSNVGKPAKMETGLVVQVPAFIAEGDVIKIDTATGAYVERVAR